MKKLMIAAAAMAIAVAANATTCAWGIPYAEKGTEGTTFTGGTAFLYTYTGDAPSYDEETGWDFTGATLLIYANDNGDGTWGKMNTGSASYLDNLSIAKDQNYAIILTSATTTDLGSFMGDDKYAAIVTGTTTEEDGFEEEGGSAFKYISAAYPDQVYYNGWQQLTVATPEPTSGLLLLIGMAGLALKRKRA